MVSEKQVLRKRLQVALIQKLLFPISYKVVN